MSPPSPRIKLYFRFSLLAVGFQPGFQDGAQERGSTGNPSFQRDVWSLMPTGSWDSSSHSSFSRKEVSKPSSRNAVARALWSTNANRDDCQTLQGWIFHELLFEFLKPLQVGDVRQILRTCRGSFHF